VFLRVELSGEKSLDLIKLHVFPPISGTQSLARHIIASPSTRIVKSYTASPWEVFLCPEQAGRVSIHYNRRQQKGRKP
jgi:hypothetical protein